MFNKKYILNYLKYTGFPLKKKVLCLYSQSENNSLFFKDMIFHAHQINICNSEVQVFTLTNRGIVPNNI